MARLERACDGLVFPLSTSMGQGLSFLMAQLHFRGFGNYTQVANEETPFAPAFPMVLLSSPLGAPSRPELQQGGIRGAHEMGRQKAWRSTEVGQFNLSLV